MRWAMRWGCRGSSSGAGRGYRSVLLRATGGKPRWRGALGAPPSTLRLRNGHDACGEDEQLEEFHGFSPFSACASAAHGGGESPGGKPVSPGLFGGGNGGEKGAAWPS